MSTVFDDYYNEINEAVTQNRLDFFKNNDRRHNAAIFRVMLNHDSNVSMYCGEMTILRNGFYQAINAEHPGEGDKIRPLIREAFQNFVQDHQIRIILRDYDPSYLDDTIVDREVMRNPNVALFALPESNSMKDNIKHFSFTQDQRIIRLEELNSHQATCMTGAEHRIESVDTAFNGLLSIARPIQV